MNPDERAKEIIRYRIERLRILAIVTLATAGGVLSLILSDFSGLRLLLAIGGIFLLAMLVGLIWREDALVWSLLQEDDHA